MAIRLFAVAAKATSSNPTLRVLQRMPIGRRAAMVLLLLLVSIHSNASLVLTEIHYNGPGSGRDLDEFLELTNIGADRIDLSGYEFVAGVDFAFTSDSLLDPGESLVAVSDTQGFFSAFPSLSVLSIPLVEYSGALSNSGERIALSRRDATSVFDLRYDDSAAWPRTADGLGDSLQRLTGSGDGSNPAFWIADQPTPGLWPGLTLPPAEVPSPPTGILLAGALLLLRCPRKKSSAIC
ncbi:MAG: lamin tail domain-containing protein [Pseudomonadota bacterium]